MEPGSKKKEERFQIYENVSFELIVVNQSFMVPN